MKTQPLDLVHAFDRFPHDGEWHCTGDPDAKNQSHM